MAKILVVEDDPAVANSVKEWLEHERHLVELVGNGLEAMDLLFTFDYELIVLDWNLPKLSGLDVCKQYRSRRGKVPVLMLTGKGAISEKEEAFDCGADDYLTKPFHPRELLARVKALLRRPSEIRRNVLEVGSVTLDPTSRSVTVGNREVNLAPREFALLEFLMRHPNEVFSDDALVNRVWGSFSEVSPDNVVRKTVKRVREKLSVDGDTTIIKTVYGVGYQLVAPEKGSG
jgi:DNA-binding response OmpR family regulator